MGRRSTAIGGGGLHQFWCDSCWDGFNTLSARDWAAAETEARSAGWTFTGSDYCRRCS